MAVDVVAQGETSRLAQLGIPDTHPATRAVAADDRLSHNLSGIATSKSFTAENYERDRRNQEREAYRRSIKRAIALSVAFQPALRFLILLKFATTLYLGGLGVLDDRLSIGTYGFMVFIIQDLLWPFTELSEILDKYQRAMASTLW